MGSRSARRPLIAFIFSWWVRFETCHNSPSHFNSSVCKDTPNRVMLESERSKVPRIMATRNDILMMNMGDEEEDMMVGPVTSKKKN